MRLFVYLALGVVATFGAQAQNLKDATDVAKGMVDAENGDLIVESVNRMNSVLNQSKMLVSTDSAFTEASCSNLGLPIVSAFAKDFRVIVDGKVKLRETFSKVYGYRGGMWVDNYLYFRATGDKPRRLDLTPDSTTKIGVKIRVDAFPDEQERMKWNNTGECTSLVTILDTTYYFPYDRELTVGHDSAYKIKDVVDPKRVTISGAFRLEQDFISKYEIYKAYKNLRGSLIFEVECEVEEIKYDEELTVHLESSTFLEAAWEESDKNEKELFVSKYKEELEEELENVAEEE